MSTQESIDKGEEIARLYNPEGLSPFPFEKIQEKHNDLIIALTDLEDHISGAIFFKEDKYTIVANIKKPKTRQYFTIAHELGHYFLHKNIIQEEQIIVDGETTLDASSVLFRLDNYDSNQLEVEANNFAANLIMPEELVRKAWSITKNVEKCAEIFKVSIVAMSIRLQKLGLIE